MQDGAVSAVSSGSFGIVYLASSSSTVIADTTNIAAINVAFPSSGRAVFAYAGTIINNANIAANRSINVEVFFQIYNGATLVSSESYQACLTNPGSAACGQQNEAIVISRLVSADISAGQIPRLVISVSSTLWTYGTNASQTTVANQIYATRQNIQLLRVKR
jgi:hypothetical protein